MKKYSVSISEWYPFYDLDEDKNGQEVPDELVERHKRVMAELEQLQSDLRRLPRE